MRINEVKETKEVVVKTEYIAVDGKVFDTQEACEQWEKSYEGTLAAAMWRIPHVMTDGEDTYLMGGSCDDKVWVMKPRNFEDIKVMNAYAKACCNSEMNLTQDDIGKTIILDFGYDNDWCSPTRVEDHLATIKKTFDKFEAELRGEDNAENQRD